MENTLIIAAVTLFGAASGTIIPYLIKTWEDKEMEFDWNYAYALVLGMFLQVATLIPDSVEVLTAKALIMAFTSGYGLQSLINRAVPRSA